MMVTKQELERLREQLQQDILCILDGIDNDILDDICDCIIERIDVLIEKSIKDQ
jgi:hypothetical protein